MAKVYVINRSAHMKEESMSQLEQKGHRLINVTEGQIDVFNVDKLKYNVERVFKDTQINEQDLLLLSGSPIINIVAAGLMKQMVGRVNVLIYGAVDRNYVKRENIL